VKRLLWLAVLICLLGVCAGAQEEIGYLIDGYGNACIVSVPDSWTRAEIPDVIDGYRVTAFSEGLFSGRNTLSEVSLPDSLRVIPEGCFEDCVNLRTVKLPDGLEEIGVNAFSGCSTLKQLELPRYVRKIGAGAFARTALEEMVLSEGLTELGAGVFSGCAQLTRVEAFGRLRIIDEKAFAGCYAVLSADFGSAAETYARNHDLPFEYAFRRERGWIYVHIENGVELSGSLRGESHAEIPYILGGKRVRTVGAGAFQSDENLTRVHLGSVNSIGAWAFSYCPNLTEVVLCEGLKEIGADTFRGCDSLREVLIPDSVTYIGERAFSECCDVILRGSADSAAERYAREAGIAFVVEPNEIR